MSYDAVHKQLRKERGSASAHPCISCGVTGRSWWAYQYTGDQIRTPEGTPYSLDIWADYAPMCNSCHATLDWQDPERRARGEETLRRNAQEAGALGGAARALKQQQDPVYAGAMKEHGTWLGSNYGRIGGTNRAARAKVDPEYAQVVRNAAEKARAAKAARLATDPAFAERISGVARATVGKVNASRRRCAECPMTSNPGALGSHQKQTGHRGFTILEPEES